MKVIFIIKEVKKVWSVLLNATHNEAIFFRTYERQEDRVVTSSNVLLVFMDKINAILVLI